MTAPRLKLFPCFILFLLLGSVHNATAQNPRGSLRGTVQDISGGRLPGAKIILRNTELSLLRETLSDSRGEFRVEDLPPASYNLTITANLFADAHTDVVVAISSVRDITVTLRNQTVSEKVVVNAPAQSITSEDLDTASAVHQAVIAQHPCINQRNNHQTVSVTFCRWGG